MKIKSDLFEMFSCLMFSTDTWLRVSECKWVPSIMFRFQYQK